MHFAIFAFVLAFLTRVFPVALASVLPFQPPGGVGVSPDSPPPVYSPYSDFDFQSLTLALNQEYLELALFNAGLDMFSAAEFDAAGITSELKYLLKWMGDQEVGHAALLSNMIGADKASKACNYTWPFKTVQEFISFSEDMTRVGEAGVFGFLSHLDSRPAASIQTDIIATESRQELIFRQLEGYFPMPVHFQTAITQSMQWTLMAPYFVSCPKTNPRVEWQNFPALNITNNPGGPKAFAPPAVSRNRTALSAPAWTVNFTWEDPGKPVADYGNYVTNTSAGPAKYAAWISQTNVTYTWLYNIEGNTAQTWQPAGTVLPGLDDPIVNGTMFIVLTDKELFVTPFNLSLLNPHVVAGPALYHSG